MNNDLDVNRVGGRGKIYGDKLLIPDNGPARNPLGTSFCQCDR